MELWSIFSHQDGEDGGKECQDVDADESENVDKKSETVRKVADVEQNDQPSQENRPGSEVVTGFGVSRNRDEDDERSGEKDLGDGSEIRSEQVSVDEEEASPPSKSVEDELKEHRQVGGKSQPLKDLWWKWTGKFKRINKRLFFGMG